MRYRVTFRERTDAKANATERPPDFVDPELMEGVVIDAVVVEQTEPDGMHNQDEMDEDDDFLSIQTETWEYEIAKGRDQEFIDALKNSQMVIEYEAMEED